MEGLKENPGNLDKAQEQKLDLVCKKLRLKKGMNVLDIGCGWANFAKFAAEKYGVKVLGVTISKEQAKLGNELCKGLPVEIRFQDYRDVKGKFDRVVSIGLTEHIGRKNHRSYMKFVHNRLKEGGLFLLHTIGWKKTRKLTGGAGGGWLGKYIFPHGDVLSVEQLSIAADDIFQLEDWHNFGQDYALTLHAWHHNFVKNWDKLKDDYDDRFYRMWVFYLLMCAGIFQAGSARLWHVVFSKDMKERYECIR